MRYGKPFCEIAVGGILYDIDTDSACDADASRRRRWRGQIRGNEYYLKKKKMGGGYRSSQDTKCEQNRQAKFFAERKSQLPDRWQGE